MRNYTKISCERGRVALKFKLETKCVLVLITFFLPKFINRKFFFEFYFRKVAVYFENMSQPSRIPLSEMQLCRTWRNAEIYCNFIFR